MKDIKDFKELKEDDLVLYDVYPEGTDIKGIIIKNTDSQETDKPLLIKTIGKKAEEFERQGISLEVPFENCSNIRRI